MELVSAKTELGREHAVGRLAGVLEQEIRDIKTLLIQILAEAELFLDYSEDEAGGADNETAGCLPDRPVAEEALERLRGLARSYHRERLYAEGALVVIAGRPNAGKSSLFNLLLREDRSIVTDIPGTTRDWIEAWVSMEGIPVRLADTAGLHVSEDPVERLGMERSRALLAEAELILYVIDGTQGITGEDRVFFHDHFSPHGEDVVHSTTPVIFLWNKADISPSTTESAAEIPSCPALDLSAKTGLGIPELSAAIVSALESAADCSESVRAEGRRPSPGIASVRQKELIDRAIAALEEALGLADRGEPLDLIAPLIREGVDSLGEITGEVSTAEILDVMFSRFCVGK
jgi:tRNA modification GTPase